MKIITQIRNLKKNKKHFILSAKFRIYTSAQLWISAPNNIPLAKLFIDYFTLWPFLQWITSLLTLILIYWASGYFYNKVLSQKGGWMDTKTRVIMIVVDLLLNFSLGIYYMNYRDTLIGTLMVQCPVFCSPLFWLIELICFYMYTRFFLNKK